MGYPTKVQLIRRKASQQWYVNFPSALAQAMQFSRGETVEWLVEDRSQLVLNRPHPPPSALKKKDSPARLLDTFQALVGEALQGSGQRRVQDKIQTLMLSSLVCLGRHTITGLLHTAGGSFQDWSALYRVFSQSRLDSEALFGAVRRGVLAQLRPDQPLVVALDDSLLPKRGARTPGVGWRRDPLGPPFQTNLIRAQRVIEIAAALPAGERPGPARLIPLDLLATDTALSPQQIVQHYVWRWDIEVNFRDQKTLLDLGQAQVRHPRSVEAVPQLLVAAYAGLLLAARQAYGPAGFPDTLPPPKWRAKRSKPRPSTQDLIQQLRAEGLRRFFGFPSTTQPHHKPQKLRCSLPTAVLYAAG